MARVLAIKSSLLGSDGSSSQLVDEFLSLWRNTHPEDKITEKNLAEDPVPHLDLNTFSAFMVAGDKRDAEQNKATALSDELTQQFLETDIVVLGVPMYNLGIPSVLKAYFDHIARAGLTFKYTEAGPVGLAGGKKVYLLSARGGIYQDSAWDFQSTYIKGILNFMGVTDITSVYADGLAISPDHKKAAMDQALQEVRDLV
ncbi:FMN-dependent NADH-azoreductase [Halioxenophilus sp. WMMB6]|uniref:FMN-dependent NADH-azoreductase n=1 Tax=Halioxenophilus sp. WMMB6 TaxID=3073815 RepID=UPI00295F1CF5|nr:FMN-dependent NADH-azoreductase [Halioxenophilus sp. WMMB6]